jgi:hypothetical protein
MGLGHGLLAVECYRCLPGEPADVLAFLEKNSNWPPEYQTLPNPRHDKLVKDVKHSPEMYGAPLGVRTFEEVNLQLADITRTKDLTRVDVVGYEPRRLQLYALTTRYDDAGVAKQVNRIQAASLFFLANFRIKSDLWLVQRRWEGKTEYDDITSVPQPPLEAVICRQQRTL